jgi:hypothetical protein
MPQDIKQLIGMMNLDDPLETVAKGYHLMARNGVFRGSVPNKRYETVPGTRVIPNNLLPLVGTNNCIGRFYDAVKKRIFFCNYNSAGKNGIYIYYTMTGVFQRLLESGVGTDGDILQFDPNNPVTSIDIMYKDNSDGDVLYLVDSLKRTTQINIDKYLASTYGTVKRKFIDVAKAPPAMPIYAVYENSNSISNNNLRNALFQFRAIHVYDNLEKSVYSTIGKVPLPYNSADPAINKDPTQNSRIAVYVQTGDVDVKKVEIWGKQSNISPVIDNNNDAGEWFRVIVLDKAELGIASNSIYRFLFYNDGSYTFGSAKEQVLLQDYVPQKANCGCLLKGTVLGYAGITEGYNQVAPEMEAQVNPITTHRRLKTDCCFLHLRPGQTVLELAMKSLCT